MELVGRGRGGGEGSSVRTTHAGTKLNYFEREMSRYSVSESRNNPFMYIEAIALSTAYSFSAVILYSILMWSCLFDQSVFFLLGQ